MGVISIVIEIINQLIIGGAPPCIPFGKHIWRFPEIAVPILRGFVPYTPSILGYPHDNGNHHIHPIS